MGKEGYPGRGAAYERILSDGTAKAPGEDERHGKCCLRTGCGMRQLTHFGAHS